MDKALYRFQRTSGLACGILFSLLFASTCLSQGVQSSVAGRHGIVSDSFYEHFGVHWGIRGRGFFFDNGGPGPVPVFGGFDPSQDGHFGVAGRNGFLSVFGSTGSSRSMASSSAMLTLPNGGTGEIASSAIRPFVMGFNPVVGDGSFTMLDERLHRLQNGEKGSFVRRRNDPYSSSSDSSASQSESESQGNLSAASSGSASSAVRGDLSVAEIKRRQASGESSRLEEARQLRDKGREHEERGQFGAARVYYQQAVRRAQGELLEELQSKLRDLGAKR